MTSLPPLLPDSPRLPATDTLTGGPAAVPTPGAGGNDFAGLVEGFAAPPRAAPPRAALLDSLLPEAALADTPEAAMELALPRAEASPATALAAWPTGKNLPEPGALLPPALPPVEATTLSAGVPAEAAPAAALSPIPPGQEAPAALLPRIPVPARAALADQIDPAEPTDLQAAGQVASLANNAHRPSAKGGTAQAVPGADGLAGPLNPAQGTAQQQTAELPQPAALAAPLAPTILPDPALLPQPATAALTPAPVTDGLAVTSSRAGAAARLLPAAARSGAQSAVAANPPPHAAPAQSASPALPGVGVGQAEADPALALAAEPGPVSGSSAGALPDSEAPAASASPSTSTPAPAANLAAAPLMPERPADPRGAAPTTPAAPQLESAIAQVGDIREALRNARPAMTLQHAEFGAVSIRLEPAAPDQWRAVLASRDPGFVPAIHAALADRAVAAAAETSASFSGHSGASQNGAGEQRYGSSPNGGQGSPQPYLGQSGQRDGEAAPDHRRPSTAAALAARGGSEGDDGAASTSGPGGLFA